MKRENIRVWVLGGVIVTAALLGGGWLLGVQPLLQAAQTADAARDASTQQNQLLQTRLVGLQSAQRNIGTLRAEAAKLSEAVPSTLDAQSFVNRLNVIAAADGVTVQAITPGDPTAYTQPVAATVGGRVEAYVAKSITPQNFVTIPMSIRITGTAAADRAFLGHVQKDSRLFLVNSVSLGKDQNDSNSTSAISGYIYALKS